MRFLEPTGRNPLSLAPPQEDYKTTYNVSWFASQRFYDKLGAVFSANHKPRLKTGVLSDAASLSRRIRESHQQLPHSLCEPLQRIIALLACASRG